MFIHQNITDAIGQTSFCLNDLKRMKEDLGNPKNLDPRIYINNIQGNKNAILFSFQQYLGNRKTYNHDIIEIENDLVKLEKDFEDIISLFVKPSTEQVTQLEGILYKIQKLIVGQIQDNPTYYLQLKKNFPNNFK